MIRHRSLPSILVAALGRTGARPRLVAALLLVNLAAALVLTVPLGALLAAELDHNLYGDAMASGASWRWFDTVDRRHPAVLGDLAAWHALFEDEGVAWSDLAELSGVPAAVLAAGLALFWLNSLLHTGWLAAMLPGRRGTPRELFAEAARFALPTSLLAVLAVAGYAAVYAVVYVGGGRLLDGVGEAAQREWVSLGLTWGRLLVTLGGMLAVKLVFDLARAALVELGAWRLLPALGIAAGELVRRGPAYLALYLVIGLGTPLLAIAWWLLTLPLGPATGWAVLLLLFVCQQVLVAGRIALRLAHLAATQGLLRARRGWES